MSQFMSNKYLRYRGLDRQPGRVIDTDFPCQRCSYNLRGLMNNSKCPECGTPIKVAEPARFVLLTDAPLADIRTLATGLWLGIACIFIAPFVMAVAAFAAFQAGRPMGATLSTVLLVMASVWFVAVWRMMSVLQTSEAAKYGFSPGSKLRLVARWSQAGWLGAILVPVLSGPNVFSGMAMLALILTGLGGLIALALMLGRLADWSCDEPAGRLLNITVWLLPLATAVLLLAPFLTVAQFLSCMAVVTWLASLVTFGLALLSLAISATWSWRHARERMDKDEELRKRIVRRPPPPPPSDEPIRLAEPGDPLPQFGLTAAEQEEAVRTAMDDIVRDVPCRECGYNLRGLKAYGRCPECGERIASA